MCDGATRRSRGGRAGSDGPEPGRRGRGAARRDMEPGSCVRGGRSGGRGFGGRRGRRGRNRVGEKGHDRIGGPRRTTVWRQRRGGIGRSQSDERRSDRCRMDDRGSRRAERSGRRGSRGRGRLGRRDADGAGGPLIVAVHAVVHEHEHPGPDAREHEGGAEHHADRGRRAADAPVRVEVRRAVRPPRRPRQTVVRRERR